MGFPFERRIWNSTSICDWMIIMSDDIYEFTLSDGTVLNNIKEFGSGYKSEDGSIVKESFAARLSSVTITKNGEEYVHLENCILSYIYKDENGGTVFDIRPMTHVETKLANIQSKVDFLSMVQGTVE